MKLINFILKNKNKSINDKNILLEEIKNSIIINEEKLKIVNNNFKESLFEQIFIKLINERCEDISTTSNYIKNKNYITIKLFGESNYIIDNSKWVNFKTDNKINENLNLKNDLYLSYSHIYFIISEHLKFYEIETNKNINKNIINYIKNYNIETITDIKSIIYYLLYDTYNETANKLI